MVAPSLGDGKKRGLLPRTGRKAVVRTGRAQEGTPPARPARAALAQTPGLPPAGGCFPHILGTGLQKKFSPGCVWSVWAEGSGGRGFGCRFPLEADERRSISPAGAEEGAEVGHWAAPALTHGGSGRGGGSQRPCGKREPFSELLGFCWFKLHP